MSQYLWKAANTPLVGENGESQPREGRHHRRAAAKCEGSRLLPCRTRLCSEGPAVAARRLSPQRRAFASSASLPKGAAWLFVLRAATDRMDALTITRKGTLLNTGKPARQC